MANTFEIFQLYGGITRRVDDIKEEIRDHDIGFCPGTPVDDGGIDLTVTGEDYFHPTPDYDDYIPMPMPSKPQRWWEGDGLDVKIQIVENVINYRYDGSIDPSGTSGCDRSSGYDGSASCDGSSGYDDSSGYSGSSGYDGSSGYSGSSGYDGSSGYSGSSGYDSSDDYFPTDDFINPTPTDDYGYSSSPYPPPLTPPPPPDCADPKHLPKHEKCQ